MKSKICYFIFCLLFILYLARANDIILSFQDVNPQTIKFSELQSNSEVYYYLDNYEYMGGVLEKVYFQGWAFCGTDYENTEKKISLIFKSIHDDKCYAIENNTQIRIDTYNAFQEKNVYNIMNGFECQFSTIGFREGTYELYIEVIENEYNYGLKNTGLKLFKKGNEFKIVEE